MVEFSYDPDIRFDDFRDDRRDRDRLEAMMIDAMRQIDRDTRPDPLMEVINNPSITMSADEKKAVNDPKVMMTPGGRLTRVRRQPKSGRDVIRSSGQFTNMGIPLPPVKRTRKKTKMDKTMSKCLKEANQKLRTKPTKKFPKGRLRKGVTQSDVMKLAHRLCKKS